MLCKILGELPAAVFEMNRPDQKDTGGFVGEACCLDIKKECFFRRVAVKFMKVREIRK